MSRTSQAPLILFVCYPGTGLLDLTGPQTVFWAAHRHLAGRDRLPYEGHTVSVHGGPVATEEGVVIDTQPFAAFDDRATDTIVVPGAAGIAGILDRRDDTVDWMVEEDCGRAVAMDLARDLVVFMKRPGGQSQYGELLRAQAGERAVFDDLHARIVDNLHDAELTIDVLAERARMSARNFARVYKETTGRTPGKAVELFRVEAARRTLEQSGRNVEQIARQCGFGSEERMRVTFLRDVGMTPPEYRRRTAGDAAACAAACAPAGRRLSTAGRGLGADVSAIRSASAAMVRDGFGPMGRGTMAPSATYRPG